MTTRESVTAMCPSCDADAPAMALACPSCGTEWDAPAEWAEPGTCGDYYPYLLDGTTTACTLEHGHEGMHESVNAAYGETRAWAGE